MTNIAAPKDSIHNYITWFPDEKVDLFSLTDGVSIEPLDRPDSNINYNVVFDHFLQENEEVTFQVKAILTNDNSHFQNYFSSVIIVPVRHLAIHLHLADASIGQVYTQKIFISPMNNITTAPEEHVYHEPFHWNIEPELNFEYKIYW